jgi:ABC-type branched-subunit amino acid transport system substrate-binding protein
MQRDRLRISIRAYLATISLFLFESAAGAQQLTPAETRGKHIYLQGESLSGTPVTALMGDDDAELNGHSLPCANCHGKDGLGRAEGGLTPSNITWTNLAKPYGHAHSYGRTHPPFTDETLARAITQGLDPARNKLDKGMPRYRMSARDLADLIAYIKRIEGDHDSGLSDSIIRVGVLIPADQKGERIRRVITAYFRARNNEGGYFGRTVEPVFLDGEKSGSGLRTSIEEKNVFAIFGFASPRAQADLADIAKALRIPIIEPSPEFPDPERAVNPFTFYLLSGISEQSLLLADYTARVLAKRGFVLAIVHGPGAASSMLTQRILKRIRSKNLGTLEPIEYVGTRGHAEETVNALRQRRVRAVIFLGTDDELGEFYRSALKTTWRPWVLLPGALAGTSVLQAPPDFRQRLLIGYPTLPRDRAPGKIAELAVLAGTQSPEHSEVVTYVMARLFEEGLRRAGRRLGRDSFMSALKNLNGYDTGLLPPISFGDRRWLGVAGAYVVSLDPASPTQATWVEDDN